MANACPAELFGKQMAKGIDKDGDAEEALWR
eukprot:CAMPEP_0179032676 /NCGR_PEP_ID=MMETSP0796-20121207/11709_1 /TAXON_ID=73915 /ORGANISM="Pyrodinium bahamense, Strain pbaha01" /LENGTH=30 /DNA_ID= /DNA_START= /DNA_END= /DNA_ORIENTATION=